MSEQGWHDFLAAEGVDDWVVLHGGATAVFRVPSLREAARLAEAVAELPGIEGVGVMLNLADGTLTVRLSRDLWKLEPLHIELARAVSAIARTRGAMPDRASVQEVQLAIAAKRDAIDVGFWRAVLGYLPMAEDNAIDPLGHGSTVWMQELDDAKPLRHAMHVDVSVARDQAKVRLKAALAAGGRIGTIPMPHLTGRSPIAQAIASASARGRTAPHWGHRKAAVRDFEERSVCRTLELPSRPRLNHSTRSYVSGRLAKYHGDVNCAHPSFPKDKSNT
jgi:4a-hydroxytetrahydrobiopterin dehydratase